MVESAQYPGWVWPCDVGVATGVRINMTRRWVGGLRPGPGSSRAGIGCILFRHRFPPFRIQTCSGLEGR